MYKQVDHKHNMTDDFKKIFQVKSPVANTEMISIMQITLTKNIRVGYSMP